MNPTSHKHWHWAAGAIAAALLAGCGGGDSPAAPPPQAADEVPASATASPTAYTQYVASLPANDTTEPLKVDKVVPPTSDTMEPLPL